MTGELIKDLWGSGVSVSDVGRIRVEKFQEGRFLQVFEGVVHLRDAREAPFALMIPTFYGPINDLAKSDYHHLVFLHQKHPKKIVRPIAYGWAFPAGNSLPINVFDTEWLGDFIEGNPTYYESGRFVLNDYGRIWNRESEISQEEKNHSNLLSAIVKFLVEVAEYNLETGRIDFVDEVSLGAGDFMFRPQGDGKFDLRLITIRSIAREKTPQEFLDVLFGNRIFLIVSEKIQFFSPQDVLVGLLQGLIETYGKERGIEYFVQWIRSYQEFLQSYHSSIQKLLEGEQADPGLIQRWQGLISEYKMVETRFYERELSQIKRYLQDPSERSDQFLEILLKERRLAQAVLVAIGEFLRENLEAIGSKPLPVHVHYSQAEKSDSDAIESHL